MLAERASRTFICSVLFLDIVEYSRKPVAEQIQLKDRFNGLIAASIRDIPSADRIILDTGDGVAVNFLGDPEDALFVAMSLRDAFAPDPEAQPKVPARIGINLGPVRLVKDLNGQPNIIGDGINVAQRIMSFAKPGQILVSRSYYEVVSHISEGYSHLFVYEGSRTDKHVREHELYSVGYSSARASLKSPAERARIHTRDHRRQTATASVATGSFLAKLESWLNNRSIAYGTAFLSVSAFTIALIMSFLGTPPQAQESARKEMNSASAAKNNSVARVGTVAGEDPGVPSYPKDSEGKPAADVSPQKPQKKKSSPFAFFKSKEEDPASPGGKPVAPAASEAEPARLAAAIPAPPPARLEPAPAIVGSAVITLAIAPWGEVYVDDNRVGVSPPVNEVEVAPGRRKIEIRNGDFPPYTQYVELKADEKIRIKHKFN